MVVRVHRRLAAERGTRELAAPVGHHLVDVHVELRAAAGHPHMQRKHVAVLPGQDLVAGLHDQPLSRVVEPPACMVGVGRCLFKGCIGGDHLPRDEVLADAEMLQRACVYAPHSLSAGTSTMPRLSVSLRTSVIASLSQIKQIRTDPLKCDTEGDPDHGVDEPHQSLLPGGLCAHCCNHHYDGSCYSRCHDV